MWALRSSCYGVISATGRVDSLFVQVFSVLFTKVWKEELPSEVVRIMVPPTIAQTAGVGHAGHLPRTNFLPLVPQSLEKGLRVFIPICTDEHWICLCFDFKEKVLWAIDSLYRETFEIHAAMVEGIVNDVEGCLAMTVNWGMGSIHTWEKKVVPIVPQNDLHSCGVIMLLCIMDCTTTFSNTPYVVNNICVSRDLGSSC